MVEAYVPKTLVECLELLNEKKLKIVAGGTDMLIQNRSHTGMSIGYKTPVIYVKNLSELNKIYEDDSFIYIGSSASLENIYDFEATPELLKNTIIEMASPAIRHTATLAGNIGNASPAGDSLVSLYILDALLEIESISNKRRVYLKDFITGFKKIDLADNEIITKIIIPKTTFKRAYFKKVGPRLSDAISKLSFVGAYQEKDGILTDIRVAFGAVNIYVVRDSAIENKIIGKTISEIKNIKEEIINWYEPLIKPIDDQRSNKFYRKEVALNLLRDFIDNLQ